MRWLNAIKTSSTLANIVHKFFLPTIVRNSIISTYFCRFNSKNDGNANDDFQKFNFRFYSGIAIAILYGISHSDGKLRDNFNSFFSIKHKFCFCAASIPPDKNTVSPRTRFNFLADVVEKTQKSVVYIEIYGRHPFSGNNISISSGSGFIIKKDGLILTNAHVVNHYGKVVVKLYDGQELTAFVEDIDTESDLATVRINARNLPELPLGSSSDLRPGEFVIAMGNPYALYHTVTAGVVSSTNRPGEELGLNSDYIQTDATIHIGNSGGPLVNLNGEVIGINTLKVTDGISFAIPSDKAIEFLKIIEEKSKAGTWTIFKKEGRKHKFLGITMLTLTPLIIKDLKEYHSDFPSIDHGVLVLRVMLGSPSYECGIKPGDVIVKVNGCKVVGAESIQKCLVKEDMLNLTVRRGQRTFEVSVRLVEPVMP